MTNGDTFFICLTAAIAFLFTGLVSYSNGHSTGVEKGRLQVMAARACETDAECEATGL